ncbi:MAG: hypothetical protein Q9166_003333 [cf. Caloplaca sp. 2 TL-2023]
MTTKEDLSAPGLPFPIFQLSRHAKRYLLNDINTVTWLRRSHNILGVLVGSLPQSPQQNVFLGLPLVVQPEEARLLVEKGLAFITNDLQCHKKALRSPPSDLGEYKDNIRKEGLAAARAVNKQKQLRTHDVLERLSLRQSTPDTGGTQEKSGSAEVDAGDHQERLFNSSQNRSPELTSSDLVAYSSTPTTSYPPFPNPLLQSALPLPEVSASSYALFKHLHTQGYFLSPGLRFGCQFLVYPGDPLRFHSHFLATSADWDEEIDLLDLIGGGRLGTGVKKGWLLGGANKNGNGDVNTDSASENIQNGANERSVDSNVRAFCIEWGGM